MDASSARESFTPYPTPSRRYQAGRTLQVALAQAGTSEGRREQSWKVPGCPRHMLWLLFAPSGLNPHPDLRVSGCKIKDPAPLRLYRAGVKAETRGERCWL